MNLHLNVEIDSILEKCQRHHIHNGAGEVKMVTACAGKYPRYRPAGMPYLFDPECLGSTAVNLCDGRFSGALSLAGSTSL